MKYIVHAIGKIIAYLYTPKISQKFRSITNHLYTGWLSKRLRVCKGIIECPVRIENPQNISIGENVYIEKGVFLKAITERRDAIFHPSIEIGRDTYIQRDCLLYCIDSIKIGEGVGIAANTMITDNVHGDFRPGHMQFSINEDIPDVFIQKLFERELYSAGPVVIEDNVHIGLGCIIMPGVTIGHDSIVNARSVVTRSVPPYSIVSGNPAKIALTFSE